LFLILIALNVWAADKYSNFAELSRFETAGRDFVIKSADRGSHGTVLAIHGGKIEWTTSELANAVAGDDYNSYLFEGIKSTHRENWDLHITSTNFDEPCALELVGRSKFCVTLHAYANFLTPQVCMGGLNEELRAKIFARLLETGLINQSEQNPCDNYWARSPQNIVNRCSDRGVQIEMSVRLLDMLRNDPTKLETFASSVRKGIGDYLN
jgi:phage replication-related protein YjqB (UPF0714/DUF867 family)